MKALKIPVIHPIHLPHPEKNTYGDFSKAQDSLGKMWRFGKSQAGEDQHLLQSILRVGTSSANTVVLYAKSMVMIGETSAMPPWVSDATVLM